MAIAIGDIHGCRSTLERLVRRLPARGELVFLGDYIDRGPDSRGVVDFLLELAEQRPCRFLMGNHEALMLDAVKNPEHRAVWFMNGGMATLTSYGVAPADWGEPEVRAAFAASHMPFYRALLPFHETETTIFVHAGIDLDIPDMAQQRHDVMMWIREPFFRNAERWTGKEVIFGHTPTLSMGLRDGQIFHAKRIYGIDTGCVYGGHLTAMDAETHAIYQEPSDVEQASWR